MLQGVRDNAVEDRIGVNMFTETTENLTSNNNREYRVRPKFQLKSYSIYISNVVKFQRYVIIVYFVSSSSKCQSHAAQSPTQPAIIKSIHAKRDDPGHGFERD